MSKKSRTTQQPIAGALVDYLKTTQGAICVSLYTAADGRQFFTWLAPLPGNSKVYLPSKMPVEVFAYFEGEHEWHLTTETPRGQQGSLF